MRTARVALKAARIEVKREHGNHPDKVFYNFERGCSVRQEAIPTGDFYQYFKRIDINKLFALGADFMTSFFHLFIIIFIAFLSAYSHQ
jgi:hypothetical protein